MTIRIDRIVTRGGDGGQTSLGDGTRISKSSLRIEAMGTVDELNAQLGVLCCHMEQDARMSGLIDEMRQIQSCLFDLGADLCLPDPGRSPSLTSEASLWLENRLEDMRLHQQPLQSFVLPGGCLVAAQAHLVRTVARRAERRVVVLEQLPVEALRFLNRLSDYFFVLARHANNSGETDILWSPGRWNRRKN
ncbi:cob(I)yrinic acid a,c-diamide adenosyltransferase [Gluconobacter kanchanaburiensis]|uniref:Corrinoid adenosyltransferase n=1 Tax=Gluconobacter kanchanaburiensis NBRC 103587 TaxID=1307948 RepID=A0A511B9B9_9PROT|nr:cob(I)yrinic acid a,c-diamide adenosyltransferase [Gluconobacter kanchanaburiensis]MBF0862717.1 cob(I)yrinic acid a,c-diamide adenosyltransferase [Gluconobacter kanchanaburiensis]GBR69243.1 cobalamin adenosyltransferase [Gluconobacter kanchanaburiensis NBRC 103587]GEK97026.1 cob(I)yrinic acid a,c-diamide adenosyltransferase [Gluconobacter kanchanaburiensis NBRC 103587]